MVRVSVFLSKQSSTLAVSTVWKRTSLTSAEGSHAMSYLAGLVAVELSARSLILGSKEASHRP
jgi:hypothetical protein